MLHEVVTEADIADIISKWTGIPVSKLLASEREKLLHLSEELHRRVIGQDEAVEAVADAIMRYETHVPYVTVVHCEAHVWRLLPMPSYRMKSTVRISLFAT
jgi:hypothetical protein